MNLVSKRQEALKLFSNPNCFPNCAMTNLSNFTDDVRGLVLSVENLISDLGKLKVQTKPEALLRRKIIDYLETASGSLIDAYRLLSDAQSCSYEDLEQVLEESEAEP